MMVPVTFNSLVKVRMRCLLIFGVLRLSVVHGFDDYMNFNDDHLSVPETSAEISRDVRILRARFDPVTHKRLYNGYKLLRVRPISETQQQTIVEIENGGSFTPPMCFCFCSLERCIMS